MLAVKVHLLFFGHGDNINFVLCGNVMKSLREYSCRQLNPHLKLQRVRLAHGQTTGTEQPCVDRKRPVADVYRGPGTIIPV